MSHVHEIEIRVRYHETDAQGVVHHANYVTYFELGRTEMMRSLGRGYDEMEREGFSLVVAEISCSYLRPARFGEVLRLRTTTTEAKGARIRHLYEIFRDDQLLATGTSTVACVDRGGQVRRLPAWLGGKSKGD